MPQPQVRYQPLAPLLSGEGSRAFLGLQVIDESKATPVVLVWVPEEVIASTELTERLRKETDHAAKLDHPNIIRVFGLAALEDGMARVVEFADGETLRRVLEKAGKLPPRFAARIVAEAAMGVHYAHLAGNDDGSPLIHGDLRPETLIVSFSGTTKVSGYGALTVAPRETGGQRIMGRRLHCAPEQVLGGRDTFNRQTDVYLLGLTLYECLTGRVPFADAPDFDEAVIRSPLPPLESDEVPLPLREVIIRATAKKAPERYASALAMRQAIDDAMGGTLPSSEDLAAYLLDHFPENDESRLARRRAVDSAVAEFARKQWERPAPAPQPAPEPARPAPPPARPVAEPSRQAPQPVHQAEGSDGDRRESPPSRPPAGSYRWLALGAVAVAALAVLWGLTRSRPPARKPRPPVDESVGAQVPPVDAGMAAAPIPDAGAPLELASIPEVDAGTATSLELVVDPPVDLTIDGNPAGRSPFEGPLGPGKHVIKLVDDTKGISITRTITVGKAGRTREHIQIGKGYVTISAPDKAVIYIDGRRVGVAPIGELSVYEGRHRVLVTVGKARWQQPFSLRHHERVYFNVEAQ